MVDNHYMDAFKCDYRIFKINLNDIFPIIKEQEVNHK